MTQTEYIVNYIIAAIFIPSGLILLAHTIFTPGWKDK